MGVDRKQVEKLFAALKDKGAVFVGLDCETRPVLKGGRKNPLQGLVTKRMVGANCMVFSNTRSNGYENKVKRHLEQVGKDPETFSVSPRAWGERVPNLPMVEHKGRSYLEVIFLNSGKVEYLVDGIPADPALIEGLPVDDAPAQAGLPLDKKVHIRTFDLNNVVAIRAEGVELRAGPS